MSLFVKPSDAQLPKPVCMLVLENWKALFLTNKKNDYQDSKFSFTAHRHWLFLHTSVFVSFWGFQQVRPRPPWSLGPKLLHIGPSPHVTVTPWKSLLSLLNAVHPPTPVLDTVFLKNDILFSESKNKYQ